MTRISAQIGNEAELSGTHVSAPQLRLMNWKLSMTTVLRFFAVACLLTSCAGLKTDRDIALERAQTYLVAHPNLSSNMAEAIRVNLILDGMTMEQVTAAWGKPAEIQNFRDGAVQHWFFGCDWPHFCTSSSRHHSQRFQSQALFENGVVVEWQM